MLAQPLKLHNDQGATKNSNYSNVMQERITVQPHVVQPMVPRTRAHSEIDKHFVSIIDFSQKMRIRCD